MVNGKLSQNSPASAVTQTLRRLVPTASTRKPQPPESWHTVHGPLGFGSEETQPWGLVSCVIRVFATLLGCPVPTPHPGSGTCTRPPVTDLFTEGHPAFA